MKAHTIHKSYSLSKKEVGEKLERQASPSKLPTKKKNQLICSGENLFRATHAVDSGLNSGVISSHEMKTRSTVKRCVTLSQEEEAAYFISIITIQLLNI